MTLLDGPRGPSSGPAVTSGPDTAAWVGVAVRLFPSAWRERYGAEFGALLDQTPFSTRVAFDVLVAAVDAHVHPTGPRRRWPLMIERLRLSELIVFASWVVFVVAGLAFQRMTDGAPYSGIAAGQPSVEWTYLAVIAGAVLSLCTVIYGSLPILLAIARTAIAARHWRHVALLAVPAAALVIWFGLTELLLAIAVPPVGDVARVALFLVWVVVFLLAALSSTVAVSAAALEAEVDGAFYRRAARPALVTAGAMLAVVVAVVAWGVALAVTAPDTFWGSEGILGASTILTWLGVIAVMAGSTVVAIRAASRARRDTTA